MGRRGQSVLILVIAVVTSLLTGLPAAPAESSVTFVAAGDYSASSAASTVLTRMGQEASDLALAVGDLSYGPTGQEQAWCDFVTARVGAGFPFQLVAGNHESKGDLNGNINDFSSCLPNQLPGAVGTYGRQYYVDVPKANPLIRFVMISPSLTFPDGTWDYSAGTARYTWTANTIDAARAAGIPWVVVGMHKPCISVGVYACEPGPDLFNLLVGKRVDLVLTGHEHMYQRTKQLALAGACGAIVPGGYQAACVADGDADLVKGAGLVTVTAGTGGVALRDVTAGDPESGYFAVASGGNQNPSHGYLRVTATSERLDAAFVPTDGTFADAFTITAGVTPPNQPPVAAFTSACTDLTCTFDAHASTDSDGSIAAYAWSFGDASSGTGVTASHPYAAGGTYTVTLTVTDNLGAVASLTGTVLPTAPGGPTAFAADDFTRTVSGGWGTAVTGGAWSAVTGGSVSGGAGLIPLGAAVERTVLLPNALSPSADLRGTVWVDKALTGPMYLSFIGRRVTGAGDYRANIKLTQTGQVQPSITRMQASGTEASPALAAAVTVSGLTLGLGDRLNVRVQVTGASPTTIRVKAWKDGTTEPTAWARTATDTFAGLQGPGYTGFRAYLSSSATNAPVTVRLDDWLATPAG
jgi:PKD repeat protein